MRTSMVQNPGVKSVGNFSTRFSLPSFLKRVKKLTDSQKDSISRTGFGNLLLIQTQMLSKNLLVELMERWDYEKHAFVLPPGEITISLLDVALILGLRVTGSPVLLREDTPFLDLEREYNVALWNRKITVASLEQRLDSLAETNNEDFVRSFLLYMFGTFLFPNTNGKIDSRYVYLLRDIDKVNSFAWGAAVLADVFHWLCRRKKEKLQYVGGCLIFLQIWCYEHIDIARPRLLNYCSTLPRICNWESTKSHHRQWFTTKFKELETNQIVWSLELTSDESNSDIIKELIVAEKRTWPDLNTRSSVDTPPHIDHTVTSGYQSMVHLIVDLEAESESESNRPAYGMQNLSSDAVSLRETVSGSSACHYLDKEKELTDRSQTSGANVAILISSDDDWEDDLQKKSQTLEEQIVHLKKKIGDLTRENKNLKNQLLSSLKFEEQNKKLMDEIENLRQENQELSESTNCLVTRLEKLVVDEITDTLDNESIENNL
ncbi:uncharacterized protein [Solanum tuberosum]|uniref:uncharacterized protein n=1 Tax=Solanum tuberosum TaxID=4113 RepID=UPI00073A4DD7|nr:PREDICTED: uncharacterized protein LOC102589384 [Solanum tuberosum]